MSPFVLRPTFSQHPLLDLAPLVTKMSKGPETCLLTKLGVSISFRVFFLSLHTTLILSDFFFLRSRLAARPCLSQPGGLRLGSLKRTTREESGQESLVSSSAPSLPGLLE